MKKTIYTLGSLAALTTPVAATISCSLFSSGSEGNRSKLEFYNYEDYISGDETSGNMGTINKYYHYQTFGDLPDFKNYILQERTVGGVGSDYFNAGLAQEGLLRKLDFSQIFDIPVDPTTGLKMNTEDFLQKIYSPEAWKMVSSFVFSVDKKDEDDKVIGKTEDIDGDGVDDRLWEYMLPYFTQNKIAAFNPFSETYDYANHKADLDILRGDDQAAIDALFTDKTYEGILTKLQSLTVGGAKLNFANNDYMRDNMMIGSEVMAEAKEGGITSITGAPASIAQGKEFLNEYKNMIGRHANITAVNTSGTDILRALLHIGGRKPIADVGFMYNGDALYGYYGGDIDEGKEGELRIVNPKNTTFLSDGIIMVKSTTESPSEQDRFYAAVRNSIAQGIQTPPSDSLYTSSRNVIYQNFDYVNYTPAYKVLYDYVLTGTNYFEDEGVEDKIAKEMCRSTRVGATKIDANHMAQYIDQDWTDQLVAYNASEIANLS